MPAEVNQDKLVLQRLLIPGKASDTEGQLDKASATNVEPRGEVLQKQSQVQLVLQQSKEPSQASATKAKQLRLLLQRYIRNSLPVNICHD